MLMSKHRISNIILTTDISARSADAVHDLHSAAKAFPYPPLGLATAASALTATICHPLLPLLRQHFATTPQAVNLTITIYLFIQAFSPATFTALSDSFN
jgi:hypothetical protein